jgi:hypothetical protein
MEWWKEFNQLRLMHIEFDYKLDAFARHFQKLGCGRSSAN